jgi:hypothetical protein
MYWWFKGLKQPNRDCLAAEIQKNLCAGATTTGTNIKSHQDPSSESHLEFRWFNGGNFNVYIFLKQTELRPFWYDSQQCSGHSCCEVGNWGRYSLPKLLFPFAFLLRPLMVKDSHKIALQHQTWGLSNFISILPSGVSTLQRFRISQAWMKTGLLKNHRPVMDLSSQMCNGLEDSWWITHTHVHVIWTAMAP